MKLEDHGMINFRCFIEPPPTHQAALRILKNKKSGKMFVGKQANSKAVKWANHFKALIRQHAPSKPLEGPLRMMISFYYPLLKEHKGRQVVHKITRPDCDNLVKLVLDSLVQEGFVVDDSRIVLLSAYKAHHINGPYIDVMASTEVDDPWKRPDGTNALIDD